MNITHSDITQYLKKYQTKDVAAGEPIIFQGEVPRTSFIVKNGIVKAYSISKQGDERIVNFCVEHDVFPTPWTYHKASSALYYYQAVTDAQLYAVPRDDIASLIHSHRDFAQETIDRLVLGYSGLLLRITALEQAKARDKILFTLYYLVQRYGKEVVPQWYTIKLNLTHQMIADLVGLTRETTATELSKLKKEKLLSYKRQRYLIHKEKLLKIIGEETFRDMVI